MNGRKMISTENMVGACELRLQCPNSVNKTDGDRQGPSVVVSNISAPTCPIESAFASSSAATRSHCAAVVVTRCMEFWSSCRVSISLLSNLDAAALVFRCRFPPETACESTCFFSCPLLLLSWPGLAATAPVSGSTSALPPLERSRRATLSFFRRRAQSAALIMRMARNIHTARMKKGYRT